MALTEANKVKWEETLRELELLGAEESIEEHTAGDYWPFTGQVRGNYFFTKDKMIFVSGFGLENFVIPYKNIKEIKKCMISLFIPTGIKITALDEEKGKDKKYKCSVMKRNNWIEYLAQKSGVNCN